jgi:hypothetical protein
MQILRARLTKGGKEYTASIAISKGMAQDEFISLLKTFLPIQDAVVQGFKDPEGVLIMPSLVCKEPEIIQREVYEVVLKEPGVTRPTSASIVPEQLRQCIADLRLRGRVNEDEYFVLRTWLTERDETLMSAFQAYLSDNDIEGLKANILTLVNSTAARRAQSFSDDRLRESSPSIASIEPRRLSTRGERSRPSTSITGERPRDRRQSYQRIVQILSEIEAQGLLEDRLLGVIKTLLLRENADVLRSFEGFFSQSLSLQELSWRLQQLAESLHNYIERPSSPVPRKNELLELVNSLVRAHLPAEADNEALNALIAEENEFVFSAFDVFESDRDQAELLDSLMRAIRKYRQTRSPVVAASSFYPDPPPIESSEQEELTPESLARRLLPFEGQLNMAQQGMLRGLASIGSKNLKALFGAKIRTPSPESGPINHPGVKTQFGGSSLFALKDSRVLLHVMKMTANCYFEVLLHQNLPQEAIGRFKRELSSHNTSVFRFLQTFSLDGNADSFIKAVCTQFSHPLSSSKSVWQNLLGALEATSRDELDTYSILKEILNSSEQLQEYEGFFMQLYEQQVPELLDILENPTDNAEQLLMDLFQTYGEGESVDITQLIKDHFDIKRSRYLLELFAEDSGSIQAAIDVLRQTEDEEDFLNTLSVIYKVEGQDESDDED